MMILFVLVHNISSKLVKLKMKQFKNYRKMQKKSIVNSMIISKANTPIKLMKKKNSNMSKSKIINMISLRRTLKH